MKYIKKFENISKVELQEKLHDLVSNSKYSNIKKGSIEYYTIKKRLKKLIDLGVDINCPYNLKGRDELPLWSAILNHNFYVAELLIDYGADVNKNISDKKKVVIPIAHLAVIECSSENDLYILKKIIDAGIDWNIKFYGVTFLDNLSSWDKDNIVKTYPQKYKEFLEKEKLNKNVKKYNL